MPLFDLHAYLDRLDLVTVPVTPDGLARLQEAQMRQVVFENVDVLLGTVPDLALPTIAKRVIHDRRGGYCHELNQIFAAGLSALGFQPVPRLARVRQGKVPGPNPSHLALVVPLEGEVWLADAGFGGPGPLSPLRLDVPDWQDAPNGRYRIEYEESSGEQVLYRAQADGDFALYGFASVEPTPAQMVAANRYSATHPVSPFPHHLMVSAYDGATRITLLDRQLKLDQAGVQTPSQLQSAAELAEILNTRLHLELDEETVNALWARIAKS